MTDIPRICDHCSTFINKSEGLTEVPKNENVQLWDLTFRNKESFINIILS